MANGEFGNLNPELYIQQDTRACLSACMVIASEGRISEEEASKALAEHYIYIPGLGSGTEPSEVLSPAIESLGLYSDQVYDLGFANTDAQQDPVTRLARIQKALQDEEKVIIAFGKKREGDDPFLHYAVITGYQETAEGNGVVLVDPSDVDGSVHTPTWEQLLEYVTPADANTPVAAWSISDKPIQSNEDASIQESELPGFDLLSFPLTAHEDVGKPIPTHTNHPTSVVMPTYNDTINWAQGGGDAAISRDGKFAFGYPRFVIPPNVRCLAREVMGKTTSLPFATLGSAAAAAYMEKTYGTDEAEIIEKDGIYWMEGTPRALEAWQYAGLGISSRQAEAALNGDTNVDTLRLDVAQKAVKNRISEHTGANEDDIYLFTNGMSAIYWLNRAMIELGGDKPSAQYGFPYTDTFSIGMFGPHRNKTKNVLDFRDGDIDGLAEAAQSLGLRSVFAEYPSNPLLWTPNLDELDGRVGADVPIVVDDTIASIYNLDDTRLPDSVVARVTSLTKYFSGFADVMGGSVILRPQSPHYEQLKEILENLYENTLWHEDAEALQRNSRIFEGIMPIINYNGQTIAGWLNNNYADEDGPIKQVFHPSTNSTKTDYDRYKKPEVGGYGGLMSLEFKDPVRARRFFDEVQVTKGPSLGAYFTLACMYTYLAHRDPSAVKKYGVDQDLVRISLGIESSEDLMARLETALE